MDLPNPEVDVTETRKWEKLKHDSLATPVEKVILNNLEILATQNRNIIRSQEVLASLLQKMTPVRLARSVAKSSTSRKDPQDDTVDLLDETPAAKAVSALKEDYIEDIFKIYNKFIATTKKKPYVTRVAGATQDANSFCKEVVRVVSVYDEDHPMIELFNRLNDDLRVDLYAIMGKKKKSEDGGSSVKGKGRQQEKSTSGRRATSPELISSQSQSSNRDLRAEERSKKKARFGTRQMIEDDTTQSEDNATE